MRNVNNNSMLEFLPIKDATILEGLIPKRSE